jgi:sodium transport system permease protein
MIARITNIWRKEIVDSLRDRKALTQALAVPLIVGIFYAVFNPLINSTIVARAKEPVTIPAQGIENAGPALLGTLKQFDITLKPFSGDLRAVVARGEQGAGLIIPPGFADAVAGERPAQLTLLTNQTAGGIFGGSFSSERLDLALKTFEQNEAARRVQARNMDPALLAPVALDAQSLATPEQLAGVFASFTLPILLATIVAQGGLFVAIDVTAGEKERGTLEALLVTPATDAEILLGKLAAVFTISCIPIVLTFMGFWVASALLPASVTSGAVLPLAVIIGAILIGLPLALFVNVVTMIVSIRTKSFKDAQSAATPVMLGVIAPAMAAAFIPPTGVLGYLIPIYGSSALVSSMATGGIVPQFAWIFSVAGSLLAAAVGIAIALRLFNRERLLYGV